MIQRSLFTILVSAISIGVAHAVVVGTQDTFEDGTELGWSGGSQPTATNGGAQGSDKALSITGSNSNLATYNTDERWAGNYLTAGVTGIKAWFKTVGPQPAEIRLVMFNNRFVRWTSSTPLEMGPTNRWQQHTFEISPSALTRVAGTEAFNVSMANIDRVMFRHDPGSPSSGGAAVDTQVFIDNIEAVNANAPTISGDLTLLDTIGLGDLEHISWTLTQNSNVYSGIVSVDDFGTTPYSISLPTGVPTGAYTLKFKGGTFLSKTINVLLTGTSFLNANASLKNGDIDQDGEVGPSDFDTVVAQFGGAGIADCDNDAEVGPSDFDIVVANFGTGDE